ncbi:MAG: AAA family ATPase [Candidatus Diapherotrites archaeon]|nr:AAA family ATPase [Candidatus Diapherotrites archaeon]
MVHSGVLPVYEKNTQEIYELAVAGRMSAREAAQATGRDVTTAYGWRKGGFKPYFCKYHEMGIPNEVTLSSDLMRLFGYYLAEGYSRSELDFCFGARENRLIEDVSDSMKRVFNVLPDSLTFTQNRCNVVYHKKPLAVFFAKYCGKGAHHKRLPSFFFELPKELFLSFLKAYIDGGGYEDRQGRLEVTSVSKQLIMDLNWLCRMHGIKSYVHSFVAPAGRTINGGKPLRETLAYRLGIGKTNNPFALEKKAPAQGLARIKRIVKKPFDGFVYDLCGCEEEAFFGGETPILLHNTNRINSIDEALRRPGRFDREIEIGVPSAKGRKEILQIHSRGMPLAKNVDMDYFASVTHGFVGADLESLTKEAAMKALRRYLPEINLEEETIPPEVLERLEVKRDDFASALKEIQPSALREVSVEVPNVRWEQIGGLEEVKSELKQAVEWPMKKPEAFRKMGIRPPRGILLYGPSGTGKTMLARAVATESEANFISIKGPQLVSQWVGESERGVRKVFKRARQVSPVVLFFDEIDSIAAVRGHGTDSNVTERMLNQLLTELDGIDQLKDVVFIAATNRPDLLDPGLLRPGRVDKVILVGAPDEVARESIFRVHTQDVPLDKEVSLPELAKMTQGYSGADIEGLVREASLIRLQKSSFVVSKVKKEDFLAAMEKIAASISEETHQAYSDFRKKLADFKPSYVR